MIGTSEPPVKLWLPFRIELVFIGMCQDEHELFFESERGRFGCEMEIKWCVEGTSVLRLILQDSGMDWL